MTLKNCYGNLEVLTLILGKIYVDLGKFSLKLNYENESKK